MMFCCPQLELEVFPVRPHVGLTSLHVNAAEIAPQT